MLSVTDDSREARGDMEDMVTLRRITRPVATYLSGPGSSRVVIGFRRSHLRLSATGSLQHSSLPPVREAFATPDLVGDIDGRRMRLGAALQAGTAPPAPTT